ncbi:MAG: HisA/HisF-related TIM barrel protein [Thermoanaerobaculia bacterium]
MQLIPSIDLRRGKVVRLAQGRDADVTVYSDDPLAILRQFQEAGAERVHIVDLDAAFGEPRQTEVLHGLLRAVKGEKIQLGGGLRSADLLRAALDSGFDRVVVGSMAVREPERFGECAAAHPGRLIPALEFAHGSLRASGWSEAAAALPEELLRRLFPFTELFSETLVTDISRDGMLSGANFGLAESCARALGVGAIVSGGVATVADVAAAAARPGISGVIIGRAWYEGRIDLKAAIEANHLSRVEVRA